MGVRGIIIVLIVALLGFAYMTRSLLRTRTSVRKCQETELSDTINTPAMCLHRGLRAQ